MKINRREFASMAGLSAAGLILPWTTSCANQDEKASVAMSSVPAPAPGKNIHPLLAKRDQKAILGRIQNLMKRDGIGALVVVKPENIAYATGYVSRFAYGAGVPAGSQAAAVIPADGNAHLFINLMESDDAPRMTNDVEVSAMPGFVFVDDGTDESRQERSATIDPLAGFKDALKAAQDFASNGKIGIEKGALLGGLLAYLNSQVTEDQSVNSDDLLFEARLIKTPWEIDMLRMAAQHMERVQSRVAQQLEPGMNALAFDTMIMAAGWAEDKEHTMQGMSYQIGIGPYWGVSQSPRNYEIKKGDLMRIDGGGTHFGYISDITRTWAVGGSPSSKHEETYDALYKGFEKGLTLLKPGVKMSELYAEVRAEVQKSPIFPNYARGHMGHSISLSPLLEDHPLFAPGFDIEFQPGMVVSMETSYMAAQGAYAPGPYNIEDSFAITEDGYDRFTTVPSSLVWDGSLPAK
ncbi:MAG: aminopeptidase P family protein [Cyclobacteriaceae bacterium]|uniref:M24 family metallopeptidase n=1 Tax=Algoriphagus sp. TaxID=1872435 RepID=UPI001791133D|nr:Xaa-Pro peptidase family protein [Algoriphagus sp.]NVJ85766.1 aminopeptidase P family protein [Algoriphagus sp.]NVK50163.1 aminopeptidase P family protein [Cyclobacteriaceae bacterium]